MNISKILALCFAISFSSCHYSYVLAENNSFDRAMVRVAKNLIENLNYDYEKYPWLKLEKFADTPEQIAKIVIQKMVSSEVNWLGTVQETPEDYNYALAYYVIDEMMKEDLSLDEAMDEVLSDPSKSYLQTAKSDVSKLLAAGKVSEIINLAMNKGFNNLHKAFEDLETKDADAPKAFENLETKKDIGAQNAWEVFGIKKDTGNMDKLSEIMNATLRSIEASSKPTIVEALKGTFEDAIKNYASEGRIAVVNFADGEKINSEGTQEGELLKAIPELEKSLQKYIFMNSKEYLEVYNSPEVGLYSEGLKLANEDIKVDVISSASIDFSKGYENNRFIKIRGLEDKDPYDDIRRRIKSQFAIAIAKGDDILITGLFGCGSYQAERNKIASIYTDELNNPLIKNKLKKVVLVYGDDDPYTE